MFQFQHRDYIVLFAALAVLVLLFLLVLHWKKNIRRKMGDEKLVKALVSGHSPVLFLLKFILVCLAFSAGIFAVMNPRTAGAGSKETRKGIDVVIALDVSKSMLAADLPPNRLERAKQFVIKLLDEMPDDRVALVLFAGKAYLQMPLTTDHGAARLFVSSATPEAVPQQGTVISEALTMSTNVFNAEERRFKSVILISDGEDHDEQALQTAKDLAEEGVMINTIGIGSPEGSSIPDPLTGDFKKDEQGNTIISILNETELKEIAGATNGVYIRLQSSEEAVRELKSQLSQIEKKAFTDVSQMNYTTYYMWLALIMLALLVVETFIKETKKQTE